MDDCLFCKIIARKIPAKIEYEDDSVLIFNDINPQAPVHWLAIPKQHISGAGELKTTGQDELLAGDVLLKAANLARSRQIANYRLVVNNGEEAGQSVFHLHVHLLAGRKMTWPPG